MSMTHPQTHTSSKISSGDKLEQFELNKSLAKTLEVFQMPKVATIKMNDFHQKVVFLLLTFFLRHFGKVSFREDRKVVLVYLLS